MRSTSKAEECLSLISNLSAEVARLAKRLEKLERREEMLSEDIDDIKVELKTKNKRNKYELGECLREREAAHTLSRKEIVERAKADIDALKRNGRYDIEDPDLPGISFRCNVEFIVNREKRAVVALLRGEHTGKVYAKGIAKAAPDDCFNEHIGKAIALRRALGVEVPQEYVNAPQPEGVEVGDVVNGSDYNLYYTKDKRFTITGRHKKGDGNSFRYAERETDWIYTFQIGRVIDDSDREEYR